MIAAQQSAEDLGGVNPAPVVFFANLVGVSFMNDDPIAKNEAVVNVLKTMPQDDIVDEDGSTSFSIDHRDLGHFLHMTYCHVTEGNKVSVDFDGIYPFQAEDEKGKQQTYNAQLITISEQPS